VRAAGFDGGVQRDQSGPLLGGAEIAEETLLSTATLRREDERIDAVCFKSANSLAVKVRVVVGSPDRRHSPDDIPEAKP
jgi:hypothetical protein